MTCEHMARTRARGAVRRARPVLVDAFGPLHAPSLARFFKLPRLHAVGQLQEGKLELSDSKAALPTSSLFTFWTRLKRFP